MFSLLLGAATVVWADFGMPGWFFVLGQIWFWTLGLPTMTGVLAVTAAWGIHGWTALPAWVYLPCAALVALAFQYASFLAVGLLWKRLAGKQP
jgi:hypothetical protein